MPKKGNQPPQGKAIIAEGTPGLDTQGTKCQTQTPLNLNPFNQWYWIKNIDRVRVNGESCIALLDNGAQINTITPGFIETILWTLGLFKTSWADESPAQVLE